MGIAERIYDFFSKEREKRHNHRYPVCVAIVRNIMSSGKVQYSYSYLCHSVDISATGVLLEHMGRLVINDVVELHFSRNTAEETGCTECMDEDILRNDLFHFKLTAKVMRRNNKFAGLRFVDIDEGEIQKIRKLLIKKDIQSQLDTLKKQHKDIMGNLEKIPRDDIIQCPVCVVHIDEKDRPGNCFVSLIIKINEVGALILDDGSLRASNTVSLKLGTAAFENHICAGTNYKDLVLAAVYPFSINMKVLKTSGSFAVLQYFNESMEEGETLEFIRAVENNNEAIETN